MQNFFSMMMTIHTAHGYILAAGTLGICLLGWIWYHPYTPTGRVWASHLAPSVSTLHTTTAHMVGMVCIQVVMAFVFTHTVLAFWLLCRAAELDDITTILFAIKVFMGYVFVKDIGHWFFEKKPFAMVAVGTGYWLCSLLLVCTLAWYGM